MFYIAVLFNSHSICIKIFDDFIFRTEEESSLRSSAIDESGTPKSSLPPGLGLRNPNSPGGIGGNAAYYGLSDRSNPGSVATTPPQSLTPER